MRPALAIRLFLVLLLAVACAPAQTYTSILVFGDSLSDTGNVAHLTQSQYAVRIPGPLADYTDGRFTDGTTTSPAATLYQGVWIEQLAAMLPTHPSILASLDGGTNYAFGNARTGAGTSSLQLTTGVSVTVDNMAQQIVNYAAAHPTIPANTLVAVWGGANDLLNATSLADIKTAVSAEIADIQALINLGATDFLVPNLPPLGAIPRVNTNPTLAAQATAATQAFNASLAAGLANLTAGNPGKVLHLYPLDIYTLFNSVLATPTAGNFTNVTLSSQGRSVNPDTYLFWDDLHPTTTTHHLIALAAAARLTAPLSVATTTALSVPSTSISVGTGLSLTATVTAAAGSTPPAGTVTFLDGTTTLGAATLSASSGLASFATIATSSLAAGTHTLTAMFAANGAFTASTSSTVTVTVVPPGITVTANPSTITVQSGSTGMSTLTVTPTNGFSGSVNITCSGAPTNSVCLGVTTPARTFSTPQTFSLIVTTNGTTPPIPAGFVPSTFSGLGILTGLLSCLSLAALAIARRRSLHLPPALLVLLLAAGSLGLLGLSGCGGSTHNAPRGTYTLTVTTTPSTGGTSSAVGAPVTTAITLVVQ